MDRRSLLAGIAAGITTATAGCMGGCEDRDNDFEEDLDEDCQVGTPRVDKYPNENGLAVSETSTSVIDTVEITATVANGADEERSDTLVGIARIEGDSHVEKKTVAVGGRERTPFTLDFGIDLSSGQYTWSHSAYIEGRR